MTSWFTGAAVAAIGVVVATCAGRRASPLVATPTGAETKTETVSEPRPDGFVSAPSFGTATDLSPSTMPIDGLTLRHVAHRDARFYVATLDLRTVDLALAGAELTRPLTATALRGHLRASGEQLVWATNSGMFHAGGRPVGLFVQDGKVDTALHTGPGSGNFGLLPNGVFFLDADGAAVRTTPEVQARGLERLRLATQSGPMLVRGGLLHHRLKADSPNRLLRSGVGVSDRHTVHFAMSDGACRFHELATLFRDGLGASDALYLDGVISQWIASGRPSGGGHGGFGGLLYVAERP